MIFEYEKDGMRVYAEFTSVEFIEVVSSSSVKSVGKEIIQTILPTLQTVFIQQMEKDKKV